MRFLNLTLIALGTFGALGMQALTQPMSAQAAGWFHSNHDSVQRCKNLRAQAGSYWLGTFRMQPPNISHRSQPTFTIKDCFTSKSECERFIANGRIRAPGFVENRYYGCKQKG